jgi:hypothetical protein
MRVIHVAGRRGECANPALEWAPQEIAVPLPFQRGDANDDSTLDLADPVSILGHLFLGGRAPGEPFGGRGPDPTPDGLACARSSACR